MLLSGKANSSWAAIQARDKALASAANRAGIAGANDTDFVVLVLCVKRVDIDSSAMLGSPTKLNKPMLHFIEYIIVGFIIGLIARAIMPGTQHLGIIMTTLLGIAGSIVGGFIGRLFSKPEPGSAFHPAGFILSIIGAIILLFIWTKLVA
jgi:uncharacterized membrane protein YeaQ/YmgE (transglycosylase-associated protein family)